MLHGFREQIVRFAVAAQAQKRMGCGLHAGAEPRLNLQCAASAGQGLLDAVGDLVAAGPFDA